MFSCGYCEYKIASSKIMNIHNRTLYGKEEKYNYHICGCQVSNKIDLATRKKIVHKGVKYLCRQCNYQATSKCNLAEYKMVLVYNGVKYHYRKYNYEAITKGSLVRHKRSVHEGVKYP